MPHSKFIEPSKISYIDKKREYFKKKWDQKNNTPVTGDNANATESDEMKQNDQNNGKYYNYQKKSYFSRNCSKPLKN